MYYFLFLTGLCIVSEKTNQTEYRENYEDYNILGHRDAIKMSQRKAAPTFNVPRASLQFLRGCKHSSAQDRKNVTS